MPTHKKGHDKDKYYHLAKDQGYRSRAAFKLIQINRRFEFLNKAKVLIDLCAAPGGWCQVASKSMPAGSIVLGVDILPIRPIRNVKTVVSDITTAECRRLIFSELQGWKADVILCDGAPNIGAAYDKDAYVQNELVLFALKVVTEQLLEGGTFCTKVYRSKDYNALIWVLQQFFEDVQAMKPNSSRSQSAEIFIVCQKYLDPKKIDPKLLDPNHVFKEVADPGLAKVDVLNKNYEKHNKRHRTGYDENLGMTLRSKSSLSDFIVSEDPVRLLTDVGELTISSDKCQQLLDHPLTTQELKVCFKDLRVLGKIDFKKMLKWRLAMKKFLEDENNLQEGMEVVTEISEPVLEPAVMNEDEIQAEIQKFRVKQLDVDRKGKKRERKLAAKARDRQALGMHLNAFDVGGDMELFTLDDTAAEEADILGDVELDGPLGFDGDALESEEEETEAGATGGLIELPAGGLEDELEAAYHRFVKNRRNKSEEHVTDLMALDAKEEESAEGRTRSAKKARLARTSAAMIAGRDGDPTFVSDEVSQYAELLNGKEDEDDDDEDDKEEDDEEENLEQSEVAPQGGKRPASTRDKEALSSKVNRWYSHPIFKETLIDSEVVESTDDLPRDGTGAVLQDMPITDKEKRKLKRKKAVEREARRVKKRSSAIGEDALSMTIEVAPAVDDSIHMVGSTTSGGNVMIDPAEARVRGLIRQGMGKAVSSSQSNDSNFVEFVPPTEMTRYDTRTYDSESEDYDNYDKAMTLALGTMMLRKSRQKAMVDASYNRFAWNDPNDLPDWFVDDEMQHNKPLLPVPEALLKQIKSRFQLTGTKDIKKVAEARARKKRRLQSKLKAAKKKANALAENSELSDRQKIKAIASAMKVTKDSSKSNKTFVVTRKTGAGSVGTTSGDGKGRFKFVDKRMRKDVKNAKNKAKREKGKRGKR